MGLGNQGQDTVLQQFETFLIFTMLKNVNNSYRPPKIGMIAVFPGFLLKYVGFSLIAERIYNNLTISDIDNLQSLRCGEGRLYRCKDSDFF